MGYIPEDTEWFVAELIMEIIVHGAGRNVVHRNLTLVRAAKPEAAFQKAVAWGLRSEVSYQNPVGQLVEIRFRGVAKLARLSHLEGLSDYFCVETGVKLSACNGGISE